MTIPPWLAPQDFVGAMAKGASLGLTRRSQDLAAQQHAASLALQRDQMEIAQQVHAQQFAQAEAKAAEALRQNNALEEYRQQSLAESQRVHDLTASSAADRLNMQDQAQASRDAATTRREEAQAKAADALEKQRTAENAFTERRVSAAEAKTANPPARTAALHAQLTENHSDLVAAEKDLRDPSVPGTEEEKMARVANLDKRRVEIENELETAGEKVVRSAARELQMITPPPNKHWWRSDTQDPAVPTLVKRSAASSIDLGANAPARKNVEMPRLGIVPESTGATYPGALPLRGSKDELIKGQAYQTPQGVGIWDGEKFIKPK